MNIKEYFFAMILSYVCGILDGLSDGDRIVTGGQNKLREGSKIKLEGQGAK